MQKPLHTICPSGHASVHMLATHTWPGPHGTSQPPQFVGSRVESTQPVSHSSTGQAQMFSLHDSPGSHG